MALSCKLSLARFSAELKFQDRAECGNNQIESHFIVTYDLFTKFLEQIWKKWKYQDHTLTDGGGGGVPN